MRDGDEHEPRDARHRGGGEYRSGAEAIDESPADQRNEEPGERAGQQVHNARGENAGAEAVSGSIAGDLDELREAEEREIQSHSDEHGGEVREQDRSSAQHTG